MTRGPLALDGPGCQYLFHSNTVHIRSLRGMKNPFEISNVRVNGWPPFNVTKLYFTQFAECHVFIKDKVVNLGHGDGMQVPCTLFFEGSSNFIEILQRQLLVVDI